MMPTGQEVIPMQTAANPHTDIVIVFYGKRSDLDACLESIERHCTHYRMHIVDNNRENTGFTRGVNKGIRDGDAPYVWLLNQDAVVLKGAQDALINRLNCDPKIGIAASMQLNPDDKDFITHGGTLRAFPTGLHKGGRLSRGECLFPLKQSWVNFASVMLKRKMIDQIGLLDESMFLFYSDADYCYWARYNGWQVWYEPESRVLHKLNVSSRGSDWQTKDMLVFMKKWGLRLRPEMLKADISGTSR